MNHSLQCKKILVTGCAGFIGSHLAAHLLKEGAVVVGMDNLSRRGGEINRQWLESISHDAFRFYKLDIRDYTSLVELMKSVGPFDLICHQAGQVAVTTSIQDPRHDFETNAMGTLNLLEGTRLHSPEAFFEYSSTNKVYGEMKDADIIQSGRRYAYADLPYGINENQPLDFHSPYGCSKGSADQYVRDYSRIFGLRTVVLRQSCIYGHRQFGIEDQGWVAWITIASMLGKPVTIYGDGMQVRDVLWIDDLIDAYIRLYQNADWTSGEIFNIGGGRSNTLSLLELMKLLKGKLRLADGPAFSPWRAGDQKIYISDTRKIESAIDWHPMTNPEQGLEKMMEWIQANTTLIKSLFTN